jgi:hypothetical protein
MEAQPASPPASASASPRRIALLAAACAVAVIALAAYAALRPGGVLRSPSISGTLDGAYVMLGPAEGAHTLARVSRGKLEPVDLGLPGALVDFDRAGGVSAAVMETATGTQDVYLLGGEARRLTSDGGFKSFVAVSPDGKTVAYAEHATTTLVTVSGPRLVVATTSPGILSPTRVVATTTEPAPFFAPADWVVKAVDLATGAISAYGAGIAPQFFSRDGASYLFFTTSAGVEAVDLATGAREDLPSSIATAPAHISADGAWLLLPTAGSYALSALRGLHPMRTERAAALPEAIEAARFSGGTLWLATAEGARATLGAYALPGATADAALPLGTTTVLRILPP